MIRFNFRVLRDVFLFLGGLAGVFYETVFTSADRPTLLLLYAAMLGLPAFLHSDENGNVDGLKRPTLRKPQAKYDPRFKQTDEEWAEEEGEREYINLHEKPKSGGKHKHEAPSRKEVNKRGPDDDTPHKPKYADG